MMGLGSLFRIREKVTPEIIDLLTSVTLGTNGAQYQHLDTPERVHDIDHPIFLSFERNSKVSGNITFCRRSNAWYIRYFAFSYLLQSSGKLKSRATENSLLKREIGTFFEDVFKGKYSEVPVQYFYAYIDPQNSRSLWMSENFGFRKIGTVKTQTFSRFRPKNSMRIVKIDDWNRVSEYLLLANENKSFFYTDQLKKGPFYVLKDEKEEIVACIKVTKVNWKIRRLPGKMGGLFTRIIPVIPALNKLIRPEHHTFIVPDAIWIRENDIQLANELFEAVLFQEGVKLMIWWADEHDELYKKIKKSVNWGILNRLVGVSPVNIVVKENPFIETSPVKAPFFISGFDFV